MRRLWLPILALITTLVLSACGGSTAQQPTAEPQPTARPRPTARPEPAEEPTAEPTENLNKVPATEPTRDTGPQLTATIDMDNLQTYSYKTGLFSLDIPASWSSADHSSDSGVSMSFTDQTTSAGVEVTLLKKTEKQTEEQLTKLLNRLLDQTKAEKPGFWRGDPETQLDGSVRVVWGYDVGENGKLPRLLGNTFIEQRGNLISLLKIVLPEEQYDALREPIIKMLNSYKIDSSIGFGTTDAPPTATPETGSQVTATIDMDDLRTYSYATGLFSIDIPASWLSEGHAKDNTVMVLFMDKTFNGVITVRVSEKTEKQTEEQLGELLNSYLDSVFSKDPKFSREDPTTRSDGGVRVAWSYDKDVSGKTVPMFGYGVIEQHDNLVSILMVEVPEKQFDALSKPLGAILNSYKIDSSVGLGAK